MPVGQLRVSCRSGKYLVGQANAVSLKEPISCGEKVFTITGIKTLFHFPQNHSNMTILVNFAY